MTPEPFFLDERYRPYAAPGAPLQTRLEFATVYAQPGALIVLLSGFAPFLALFGLVMCLAALGVPMAALGSRGLAEFTPGTAFYWSAFPGLLALLSLGGAALLLRHSLQFWRARERYLRLLGRNEVLIGEVVRAEVVAKRWGRAGAVIEYSFRSPDGHLLQGQQSASASGPLPAAGSPVCVLFSAEDAYLIL